jgi:hypothetical protein
LSIERVRDPLVELRGGAVVRSHLREPQCLARIRENGACAFLIDARCFGFQARSARSGRASNRAKRSDTRPDTNTCSMIATASFPLIWTNPSSDWECVC